MVNAGRDLWMSYDPMPLFEQGLISTLHEPNDVLLSQQRSSEWPHPRLKQRQSTGLLAQAGLSTELVDSNFHHGFLFFCHVIFLEDNALTPLERELESHLCQTMSWVSDIGSPKANIFPLQGVDISPLASTRDQLLSMCVYHDTPALTALYISRTIH